MDAAAWILVLSSYGTKIPMISEQACVRAIEQVSTKTRRGIFGLRAICINTITGDVRVIRKPPTN